MNDLLGSINDLANEQDEETGGAGAENGGGDPQGRSVPGDMSDRGDSRQPIHMQHFFREVEIIKADIEAIQLATRKIGEISEEAIHTTTTEEENELSAKLRPLVDNTNTAARRTKNLLGLLKEENQKLSDDDKINPSDYRVRANLCNTLTRKFIDEMKMYQTAQQRYKADIKKKIARQVHQVKPDATDEEIEAVMRSSDGRDGLIRQQILANVVNDEIKTTYNKVAGKYQDVLALESSVAELHQMFMDFALLTEQQGELLDQIEFQVRQAGDHVEDGNVDMYESIQYQSKIRKKQCYIMMIVVGGIVVLMFASGMISF